MLLRTHTYLTPTFECEPCSTSDKYLVLSLLSLSAFPGQSRCTREAASLLLEDSDVAALIAALQEGRRQFAARREALGPPDFICRRGSNGDEPPAPEPTPNVVAAAADHNLF